GRVSLTEAFARIDGNEAILHGMHISPYDPASRWNVDPVRPRKLLLHRREIRRLIGATQQEGYTLVPLELYLKDGLVKVALALGQGKKRFDKREDQKKRDADREMQRAVRRV
ncbi:MAG TPA: SsrA-binding protein SmpB, partial [Longimicrobiales bacterium]|nr:SsrA-binding protein SmpB [Longimicrobiales bacterium]